MATEADAI